MKEISLTTGKVGASLLKYLWPLMLSLALQAGYGMVDIIVVGQFAQSSSISAVAVGSQIMMAITFIANGFSMGATIVLGNAVGAKEFDKAGAVVVGISKILVVFSIVATIVMIAFPQQLAMLVNTPPEALDQAVKYLRVCGAGMIFISAYNGICSIYRGLGDSKSPLYFVGVACIVNIILDFIFVAGLKMEAMGAALATVIAQIVSVIFSLLYIKKLKFPFAVDKSSRHIKIVGKIMKVGTPIATQDFLTSLSFVMIFAIVNKLGVTASAAIGIEEKFFTIFGMLAISFRTALSAFVAQNDGAKLPERNKEALRFSLIVSVISGVLLTILLFFCTKYIARIFTHDQAVVDTTATLLKGSCMEYFFFSISFCFLGYFNGKRKTNFILILSLTTAFLVRIPLSYYFSTYQQHTVFYIGLAMSIAGGVTLVATLIYHFVIESIEKKKGKNNTSQMLEDVSKLSL